jgi:hypothetical protein
MMRTFQLLRKKTLNYFKCFFYLTSSSQFRVLIWILFLSFLNHVVISKILEFEEHPPDSEKLFQLIITEPFIILEFIIVPQIFKQLIWEILWNSGAVIVLSV